MNLPKIPQIWRKSESIRASYLQKYVAIKTFWPKSIAKTFPPWGVGLPCQTKHTSKNCLEFIRPQPLLKSKIPTDYNTLVDTEWQAALFAILYTG